jgi:nucleoid-associated protein YgaU
MAGFSGLNTSSLAAIGGVAVVAITIGGYTVWRVAQPAPLEPTAITAPTDAPAVEEVAAAGETEAVVAIQPEPPAFDVVRVEPDGSAVIAGRSIPESTVSVLLDDVELITTTADSSGKFVALVNVSSSDTPRVVSLLAKVDGVEVASLDTVILAPSAKVVVVAEEAVEALTDAAATEAVEVTTEPAAPEEAPANAPAVLLADETGVTVLQTGGAAPDVLDNVVIDSIAYDPEGAVTLSGRGTNEGFVRVYVDNTEVVTAAIASDGQWRTELPNVDKGVYTLRVDEVNATGAVTSRTETPFKREDVATIAAANPDATPAEGQAVAMTVQPGMTLWGIARERWGSGVLYVQLFEANKDRIKNPDLIYPGQVFAMPEGQ